MRIKTLNSCLLKTTAVKFIIAGSLLTLFLPQMARAQGPEGKSFGFGILLGDPIGATVKLWTAPDQAFVGDIGKSYFGPLRIQADYLWHFSPFHSYIVKMYAGPGLAIAVGHGDDDRFFDDDDPNSTHLGVGARVMFGLNIIPLRTPLEIFFELGPMISFVPVVDVGIDFGVGIRFYP